MIVRDYATFSTSRADDHAYLALNDIAEFTAGWPDTRIVGGLMVSLLAEAFPTPGTISRRTADVDTAISIEIAHSGELHERLVKAGYVAERGNRYRSDDRVVDLLVPSGSTQFSSVELGGRGFHSAPGLLLALGAEPVEHRLDVTLSDGATLHLRVHTPTVEHAVILKSYATGSRTASKDFVDLFNLLSIAHHHPPEEIGGWRLDDSESRGARKDSQTQLHRLASHPELRSLVDGSGVAAPVLSQLIERLIARAPQVHAVEHHD